MRTALNQIDAPVNLLGTVLHNAALASRAIIDAIPEDASVYDEADTIAVATAPVDALARLILTVSSKNDVARARAYAWMEGNYWATTAGAAT